MTGQPDPGQASSYPAARGVAGLVVANSSLILAVLIYMGWAYDDALYGYFHLRTLDLNFGTLEYALRSLSLFSPDLVIVAVAFIAIMSVRVWARPVAAIAVTARARVTGIYRRLVPARPVTGRGEAEQPPAVQAEQVVPEHQTGQAAGPLRAASAFLAGAGAVVTGAAFALYWAAMHVRISTFLVLAVLGAGPLLLTWPTRAARTGRGLYAFAIVVAAICALWAASVYAKQQGTRAAESLVRDLPARTAVVIYSTQRLALSGPGVSVQSLAPGLPYHFRYTGLRLLLAQSGTYYLLPVNWTPQMAFTYIVSKSEQVRIVLY